MAGQTPMNTPGGHRVTIADVAALAGVSVAAVSKVVNNRSGISETTAARVRAAAAQLSWSPSSAAVALRGARNRTIGLVAARDPDLLLMDPHFGVLVSGIESELSSLGYGLLLHMVDEAAADSADAEAQLYRRLAQQRRVDGVLLTESRVDDPRPALLRSLDLPAVLVGRPWTTDPIAGAREEDDVAGLREAAAHLLRLGHRRIAYVHDRPDRADTRFRLAAFRHSLAVGGATPVVVEVDGSGGAEAGAATTRLLGARPGMRPTALVFANDCMAAAGMSAASRAGLRVPEDVSIVGHDDLPIAQWLHPRLTTVSQDLLTLGRAGARRLLRVLGEDVSDRPEVSGTRLVTRESTGPAPD